MQQHGNWLEDDDELSGLPAWSDAPGDNDGKRHILPHNDLFPHVLSHMQCWCHPEIDDEDEKLVIHNSADGRELYERGVRLLN